MNEPPTVQGVTRIVLRPIGNPLPLGFLALGGGTLLLSGLQLGWLEPAESRDVALILLAFVVAPQLITSLYGYLARDVIAGTGMGILAGTWLSISLVMLSGPPGSTSKALGLLLLASAVAMLVPALGSALGKVVATLVLGTTAVRFAVTGVYELTGENFWKEISGAIGLLLCALALYAALAMLLEDVRRTTVLPTFRRGRGKASLSGNLDEQLQLLEREAGIREQL